MKQIPLIMLMGISIIGVSMIAPSYGGVGFDIGQINLGDCTFATPSGLTLTPEEDTDATATVQEDGTLVCVGTTQVTDRFRTDSESHPEIICVGQDSVIYDSWHQNINNNGHGVLVCKNN